MCRIVGLVDRAVNMRDQVRTVVAMRDTMTNGGPDDAGLWHNDVVILGHRRLSIIDLSVDGHQPMTSTPYVISYNGEIYNYKSVRQSLKNKGYVFNTESDTEVILVAFKEYGHDCVSHFHGMFSFAIYDTESQKLHLCRDRFGVKPLYYYHKDTCFAFTSELKAFHQHPGIEKQINHEAVRDFMHRGYISAPNCIYNHTYKLKPGTWISYDIKTNRVTEQSYYNTRDVFNNSVLLNASEDEITEQINGTLQDSFRLRMVSDVPVGIFLSGGIDSTLLTSLLAKQNHSELNTFTIGFEDPAFNEASYAAEVANYLGTNHQDLVCTERDFTDILPHYSTIFDEPFGDSSGIVTHLVAKLAQSSVKVCLSADGADEMFGGYSKYGVTKKFFPNYNPRHDIKSMVVRQMVKNIPLSLLMTGMHWLNVLGDEKNLENKVYKLKNGLVHNSIDPFFEAVSGYAPVKDSLFESNIKRAIFEPGLEQLDNRLVSYLGVYDICNYLEGDILTKVDRATMYTSLEGRDPFLDQDIFELAICIPDDLKIKNGQNKYLLRKLLGNFLPAELFNRPKQGFAIPLKKWLRSILSEDLRTLANDKEFMQTFGLSQPNVFTSIEHFLNSNKYVNEYRIWYLFVLYQWFQKWHIR